ncbi:MAG: phosphatase PAP2 family protein [Thermoanaerobaculia bacterium]
MQSQILTERLFAPLDAIEVETVARTVVAAERLGLSGIARLATRLGNGWLYPLLTVALLAAPLNAPLRFLLAAALSLAIAFGAYPLLKTFLGRARPCDYDPALVRDLAPLDTYSCPSGHAMTAAAYGVPLVFAWPAALPLVIALCAVIGWSRVALGHHYVSDVVVGTVLGAAIAGSVSAFLY